MMKRVTFTLQQGGDGWTCACESVGGSFIIAPTQKQALDGAQRLFLAAMRRDPRHKRHAADYRRALEHNEPQSRIAMQDGRYTVHLVFDLKPPPKWEQEGLI